MTVGDRALLHGRKMVGRGFLSHSLPVRLILPYKCALQTGSKDRYDKSTVGAINRLDSEDDRDRDYLSRLNLDPIEQSSEKR